MPENPRCSADDLPQVTEEDVQRFRRTADIHDVAGFVAELRAFMLERWEIRLHSRRMDASDVLAGKAATLRAQVRWTPRDIDVQRGREALLEAIEQPHNLPVPEFAKLANKSRQQIYKDISARRLLALDSGSRGKKLPDWQLDPVKQQLTQTVMQGAVGVDTWTLYQTLNGPLESLDGRSPVDAVTASSVDRMAVAVFNALGVH